LARIDSQHTPAAHRTIMDCRARQNHSPGTRTGTERERSTREDARDPPIWSADDSLLIKAELLQIRTFCAPRRRAEPGK
ncbi:MAG: hypothetical protein ACRDP7_32070, partial [Trebonia sp.]